MMSAVNGWGQALTGIVIGLVVVGLPLLIRYLISLGRGMERIMAVLVTPAPTPLVPNPEKGLVDVVAGLVRTSRITLEGTATLIKDTKPNDGSASHDVLNRIDEATKTT